MDIAIPVIKISLGTSIVIGILLLFTPLIDKRYDPKWKCWIWLIIILRLTIPINLNVIKPPISVNIPVITTISQTKINIEDFNNKEKSQSTEETFVKDKYSIGSIINIVWSIGASVTLLYQVLMYIGFRRQILRWSIPIQRKNIHDCYINTYRQMDLKSYVRVLVCDKVSSPMMIGFIEPMLILPHENYNEVDLSFIIKHELIHHKNHHIWFKLLLLVTSSIHWFNPLIYIARSEINKSIELCCDSEVIKNKSFEDRRAYGNAIIDSIAFNKNNSVLSTYFNQSSDVMKGRLRGVLDMKIRSKGIIAFVVVLLCTLILSEAIALTNDGPDVTDSSILTTESDRIQSDDSKVVSYDVDAISNAVLTNDIKYITDFAQDTNSDKNILNTKNRDGLYPLEMTLVMTNCEMAELLLNAGADPLLITKDNKSILDKVLESDSDYYIKIFKSHIE